MKNLRVPIILAGIFFPALVAFSQNHWESIPDMNADARFRSASFAVNGKGYVAGGSISGQIATTQVWQYDPATTLWTQRQSMPNGLRKAVGFSISGSGYVGTGETILGSIIHSNDFYKYDPGSNSWSTQAEIPGPGGSNGIRTGAFGFAINGKGYLGGGVFFGVTPVWYKDFWEYNPANNTWTRKADVTNPNVGRQNAATFVVNGKGYMCNGNISNYFYNDIWEYNPSSNTWTQKNNHPGIRRSKTAGFSINNKGYLVAGDSPHGPLSELWQYDQSTDTWTQRTDFIGSARTDPVAFVISNKAYVGTGNASSGLRKDFFRYDPTCDYSPFITGNGTVCTSNITFTAKDFPANTTNLTWSKSSNLIYVSGQGTSNYTVKAQTSASGSGFVRVQFTTPCGNINTVTKNIWVGKTFVDWISFSNSVDGFDYFCSSAGGNTFTINTDTPGATYRARLLSWPSLTVLYTSPAIYQGSGPHPWTYTRSPGYYEFQVKATNVCGTTDWIGYEVEYVDCSGSGGGESFSVFPNPASTSLTLAKVSNGQPEKNGIEAHVQTSGLVTMELRTKYGELILDKQVRENQFPQVLNIAALENGLYILRVIFEDRMEFQKIEISR